MIQLSDLMDIVFTSRRAFLINLRSFGKGVVRVNGKYRDGDPTFKERKLLDCLNPNRAVPSQMKIALCHSMNFAKEAADVQKWFEREGHQAFPSSFNGEFLGLTESEIEKLKLEQKYNQDAMREHWATIDACDAVLVLNFDKNRMAGYIGGNTFLEMGFAYILRKPIFLLNPVPRNPYFETEIIAMKPMVVHGDLSKVAMRIG